MHRLVLQGFALSRSVHTVGQESRLGWRWQQPRVLESITWHYSVAIRTSQPLTAIVWWFDGVIVTGELELDRQD